MAALNELEQFDAEVFRIETDTVWKGGEEGNANKQGKALANRTGWLKAQVEALGNGKQPLDATLTALAALAIVADRMIYSTGPDTFALTPLSAFIRTLLDDPDAATARATLGAISQAQLDAAIAALVDSSPAALDTLNELASALGDDANFATTMTNQLAGKQPLNTDLTAISGLVSAANKMLYATGPGTWGLSTLTAFARSLLDDADAATARTTLGAIGATYSLGPNGYIIFPAWFAGGLVIQWGSGSPAAGGENYLLPVAFPTAFWHVLTTSKGSAEAVNTIGNTTSTTQVFLESTVASSSVSYLAFGN